MVQPVRQFRLNGMVVQAMASNGDVAGSIGILYSRIRSETKGCVGELGMNGRKAQFRDGDVRNIAR